MTVNITAYHTQEYRLPYLSFPILATGNDQWLGDGFYFWQDYEFAKWWGKEKKCKKGLLQYSIYETELVISEDDFIDTVFNEQDYYEFVKIVEKFALEYQKQFGKKANLEDFNDFISDYKVWDNIKAIRFQDVPKNDTLVEVNKYYYKKRIQIRVNAPSIISKFAHLKDFSCIA